MIATCWKCDKKIKIGTKIEKSILALKPGKSIKVKCPDCQAAIVLDAKSLKNPLTPTRTTLKPPSPPDISWLMEGDFEDEEAVEDVPMALILMGEIEGRDTIIKGIESIGYRVEIAGSAEEAIEKMRFVDYASVVLHSRFESKRLESSSFHQYMSGMHMSKRRYIFYILVGPEFSTFYNLEALSSSANLVVNDNEVSKFDVILRKAIPEYEQLFGPIMEELRLHGR
jgi:hypothetical protein